MSGWWLHAVLGGAIAAVIWLLRRRWRSRRALEARVAELTALSQAGRAILEAPPDVDRLCELIYQQASQIVDTSNFQLGLFEDGQYRIKVWVRRGERQPPASFDLTDNGGLVGWMRRSRQPLLVHDFLRELDRLPARPRYVSDDPPRSAIFVPLIAQERVIGAMAIQSYRPAAFTPDHQRLLSIIANQAAAAIENARLFQQAQRRARQLTLIGQVSRQVTAVLELDDLFQRVVTLIHQTFGYYHVALCTVDEARQEVVFQASLRPELEDLRLPLGEGLVGSVAQSGEPALVNDVSRDERYLFLAALPETRSELVVPLKVEGRVLGVLDVQSDGLHAFSNDDLFILETLADQVAIAIQEARMYAQAQERARQLAVISEVGRAVVSILDLDRLLDQVVMLVQTRLGYPYVSLFVVSEDEDLVRYQAGIGRDDRSSPLRGQTYHLDDPNPVPWVAVHGEPLLVHDLHQDARWRAGAGPEVIRSVLAVPLKIGKRVIGVLQVQSEEVGAFGEEDRFLLQTLADTVAVALRNAELYAAEQAQAWVSTALLQVAEAVVRQAELSDVLDVVARLTPMLVGVEVCLILTWDETRQVLLPGAAYGLDRERFERFRSLRLPREAWPALLEPPAEERIGRGIEPLEGPVASALSTALGLTAPVAFPLWTRGKLRGVLVVTLPAEHPAPTEYQMMILGGVARQTAMAIENARLQEEAVARQRLEQELEVARSIQESFLPRRPPEIPGWEIAALWQAARQVSGDFYDFIPLPQGRWGLAIADVADKGVPAALFMALCRTLLRAVAVDGRGPAQVLVRANELILSDARSDLFVTVFYGILDPVGGRFAFASGGHNPPLLFRAGAEHPVLLTGQGMALGVVEEVHPEERWVDLEPEDLLVLYTDGVTEAINEQEEEFGLERLRRVVVAHRERPAAEIAQAIGDAVAAFTGDVPRFDDLTLVVLRRLP